MSAKTRFGAARFASTHELLKAGLINNGGLHHGYTFERKPRQIGFQADTGSIIIGSAGSGKLSTHLAYQIIKKENTVFFDPKGEGAAICATMMPWADVYLFNPFGLWTEQPWYLPACHRFNILSFVNSDSPMLFEDMLTIATDLISKPKGGGGNSEHFWGKAVMVTTALLTFLKEVNPHASLIDVYNVLGDIRGGGQDDFFATLHYPAMMGSSYSQVRQVADELLTKRTQAPGEFESILSTISNSVQILGSPALQRVLSGTSTVTMPEMLRSSRPFKLFIMIPVHLIESCAGIIRALISSITISQQRHPINPVHIIIDEAGQLGNFESLKRMYSFGRGAKIRISTAWQNIGQGYDNLGKDGFDTVFSNAQSKVILSVASEQSARFISEYMGKSTHYYDPYLKHAQANINQTALIQKAIQGGGLQGTLPDIAKAWEQSQAQEAVARPLKTTEELINMPPETGLLLFHGLGVHPYEYQKWHYFLNPDYAHLFLLNPFHAPFDRVRLPRGQGRFRTVPIVCEPVPEAISHLAQYKQGYWSYPKGHCPYQPKRKLFGLFG